MKSQQFKVVWFLKFSINQQESDVDLNTMTTL